MTDDEPTPGGRDDSRGGLGLAVAYLVLVVAGIMVLLSIARGH